jgi:post-segregation antitoxin (ccd killing protein)
MASLEQEFADKTRDASNEREAELTFYECNARARAAYAEYVDALALIERTFYP